MKKSKQPGRAPAQSLDDAMLDKVAGGLVINPTGASPENEEKFKAFIEELEKSQYAAPMTSRPLPGTVPDLISDAADPRNGAALAVPEASGALSEDFSAGYQSFHLENPAHSEISVPETRPEGNLPEAGRIPEISLSGTGSDLVMNGHPTDLTGEQTVPDGAQDTGIPSMEEIRRQAALNKISREIHELMKNGS